MPFNPGRFPRQPVGIWWRPARLPVVLVGPGPRPTVQVSRFATPSRLLFQSPELNTSTVQRGPTLLQGLAPDSASEVEVRPDPVILDELLGESADPSRIVVETFGVLGEQSTCCTPTVDKPHPWMNVLIGGWSIFIHGCMCSSMDHAVAGGSTPWRIRPMRPSRSMDETAPSVDCITVHLLPLTPKLPYYSGIPQFFLPSFLIRLRDILSSNPAS